MLHSMTSKTKKPFKTHRKRFGSGVTHCLHSLQKKLRRHKKVSPTPQKKGAFRPEKPQPFSWRGSNKLLLRSNNSNGPTKNTKIVWNSMNQKKNISEERTSCMAFPELAAFWNQDIFCLCLWYLLHFAPKNLLFLGIGRIFRPWIFHLLRIWNISNLESWLYQLQHFGACSKSNLLSPRYMQHSEKKRQVST